METTTKTIATLVPEKIEGFEMEFAIDPRTGLHPEKYDASLTVKVGNDARKLHFNKTTMYHGSEYANNEAGERVCITEAYSEEILGIDPYTKPFDDLNKLGIEVDITALVDEYTSKLLVAMYQQEEMKRAMHQKAYDTSWIHKGLVEILASKKMKAGVTATKSDMAEYGKNSYPLGITLTYKEKTVRITLTTVSTGDRFHSRSEERFRMEGSGVPGYNGKYYRTLETCLAKFISFIDTAIAVHAATLTHAQKQEAERVKIAKTIGETFGMKGSFTVEEKYHSYGRGYRDPKNRYTTVEYYIQNTGKKYRIGSTRKDAETITYSLGGFNDLSVEKVKAIIEILDK